ncbi:MAG: cytochrome P450 [Alphaproteobacteria bacterium]|nr:MAG: cytochrome P450 [Alphaproteobacteria bacterium]
MGGEEVDKNIITPVRSPGPIAVFLQGPRFWNGVAAFLGMACRNKPLRLGKRVIAARHAHVSELLRRDLDFGIAAINETKIVEVNEGPFILGMDRSELLERERRALYEALSAVDMDALRRAAEAEIDERLAAIPSGGEIDVVGAYARPVAAHTAQKLFGITGPNDAMFMEVTRSVFGHTFLNQANDKKVRERAIRAGHYMSGWLRDEIARRRKSGKPGEDMMGHLLRQGIVDDDGARRTLGGMLVGSVDTTATCVAKIVWLAGRDQDLAIGIRRDLGDIERLYGWCNEALRWWMHNPLVVRHAIADCDLAGCAVKKGDSVLAMTIAAMRDPSVFPEPKRLRPDRDPAAYLHLGAGLHPCSGRPVNRFQIPLLVAGLVRRDLVRVGRVRWAGPFPHRLAAILGEGQS